MINWILAQTSTSTIEMADVLRANGKIYVVVTVVLTIVLLILFYLLRLDRKIGQLEKELSGKQADKTNKIKKA